MLFVNKVKKALLKVGGVGIFVILSLCRRWAGRLCAE